MIKPEVLDAMLKAGCTAEQIVVAIKADMIRDEDDAERRRQNGRDRQRRHRERIKRLAGEGKAGHADVLSDASVTVTDVTKERSPTPPKENNIYTPHTPQREGFEFEDFWKLYPNKTGKPEAKSSFVHAIYRAEPEEIRSGLMRVMAQWEHPKFIPHPARWLDRDGWNDAMIPKRERKQSGRRRRGEVELTPERRVMAVASYISSGYWSAEWEKRPTAVELDAANAVLAAETAAGV